MDNETIGRIFAVPNPPSTEFHRINMLHQIACDFALTIQANCPESREKSLALTKLEECIMWANAAIDRNETEGGDQ
ncbi:hypothetical protein [Slackia isoflavoniconvertens]|uniref:Acb2/Tad1 domain-containing protein n=1 Tax=Slackia isoflavoniconvertens TaxID=572010 RepID=UPI003A97CC4C